MLCGIGGIVSKRGRNVASQIGMMLREMRNRGPDGVGIATENSIIRSSSGETLRYSEISGSSILGHTRLAIVGGRCGAQPFESCDGKLILEHNGEIYNYKQIRQRLEKNHDFRTRTDSEVIVHLLEEEFDGATSLVHAIRRTVAQLDGIYAMAIRDSTNGTIALVRDRLGVRQLYYAVSDDFIAFASERKALWAAGLSGPIRTLLPNRILLILPDAPLQPIRDLPLWRSAVTVDKRERYRTMKSSVRAYRNALLNSMKKRTQDIDRIGIVFSGGIDSVLLAWIAKKMVPMVTCYTCGFEGSRDIEYSREIAAALDLDLRVSELGVKDVEEMLPEIIHTIEDSNAGQVEVAIPVYGAVRLAHDDGIRVMLTGQGADELFAGYPWYSKIAKLHGYSKMRERMADDLLLLYKETLEREDKISMAHSVEIRVPFLDVEVVKTAMAMDPRLNIDGTRGYTGKLVHREAAVSLGIPDSIAFRTKDAAQHGSGMHEAIDSIARKRGFDESCVTKDHLADLSHREPVGSSQRYGHVYEKERIWAVDPHVQLYLDSISRKSLFARQLSVQMLTRA
jgi:asparagine synthase (glutamine-hydrolysing)